MRVRSTRRVLIAASIIAMAAPVGFTASFADPSHSAQPAVVCTSEAGGPFVLRAQGTLTRTATINEVAYRLTTERSTYRWRFVTNVDKTITFTGPGQLLGTLVEEPKRTQPWISPPFSQSAAVNGELKEELGSTRLWVLLGHQCPS